MPAEGTPRTTVSGANPTEPASGVALSAETGARSGLIRLPAGIELDEAQVQKMAAERPVRLIVLAGAVDCGKTTLLTSV
jgi:hypothetical protein